MSTAASGIKELHQLHIQLQAVRDKLESGPRKVLARRQLAERKLAESEEMKKQLKRLKMNADEKSLQLKINENKILELKQKLNAATTNREYDIFRTQVEADEMANSVLEDEILEALDKVDQMQANITEIETGHATAVLEQERVAQEVQAAEPALNGQASELESSLEIAEEILPDDVAEHYRRLILAHGPGALATVEEKACTSCYTILSPNPLVELAVGKIVFCRSCGRLLYLPDAD